MIRSDHIDGAVHQSPDHRLTVRFLPQGRIHLRQCTVLDHGILSQGKMMRSGFRVDIGAALFGLTHQLHRFLAADMLNVDAGSGLFCQLQVPLHQRDLRLSGRTADTVILAGLSPVHTVVLDIFRIFFMEADGHVQFCGDLHGAAYQFRI